MSNLRVHNLVMSLDGFATGEGQSLDSAFGHAHDEFQYWFDKSGIFAGMHPLRSSVLPRPSHRHGDRASAPKSWDATSSVRPRVHGLTTDGVAGGVTNRRSIRPAS